MRDRFALLLRAPILHFFLAGGLLFALASRSGDVRQAAHAGGQRASIKLTAETIERLRSDWVERFGSPPNAEEEESLQRLAIDEEILFREALALGFDRDNRAVRGRLVQLAGFLDLAPEEDWAQLEREARSLDLVRSDPVIRRHLVEMMRVALEKPRRSDMPSEDDLSQYYEQTAERWALPARVRLTHVYLGADRHGASLAKNAARLLDRIRRDGIGAETGPSLGNPFALGSRFGPVTREQLDRSLGAGFFDATAGLETGVWEGPVRSPYGLHLVWVHEREPARRRPLDAIRNQVLLAFLNERGAERLQATLQTLRTTHRIEVERPG
jgi:hypothetical protein